jgi:hypothetical protein
MISGRFKHITYDHVYASLVMKDIDTNLIDRYAFLTSLTYKEGKTRENKMYFF